MDRDATSSAAVHAEIRGRGALGLRATWKEMGKSTTQAGCDGSPHLPAIPATRSDLADLVLPAGELLIQVSEDESAISPVSDRGQEQPGKTRWHNRNPAHRLSGPTD